MSTALLCTGVSLALFVALNFHCWDRLLQHECACSRSQWEADGQPWSALSLWLSRRPADGDGAAQHSKFKPRASRAAAIDCMRRWLTATPDWALADPRALLLLRRWRGTTVGCLLSLIALMTLLMVRELAGGR